ncbi:YqgE/AlgH family protein [Tardibacter chloracetimidivorans]
MPNPTYLSSQLLLAMPGIGDPRFERAVIAMCVHDEGGAMGIGVGTEIEGISLHGLLTQLEIDPGIAPDVPVLAGGPVEPQRGFVLHSQDWAGEGSVQIGNSYTLTSTLDVLKAIAEGKGPGRWLVALGYAGWEAGQLDEELTHHGWFATPVLSDVLFDTAVENRWATAFAAAGIDPALLTATPGRA